MALKLTWSGRRQLLYYAVAAVVLAVALWSGYQTFFTAAPTCQDSIQNEGERGVDCGGPCSLVCTQDTKPLVVLWSRAFPSTPGTYTAAAYVQSNNLSAGTKGVHYSFQLFDDQNSLVVERDGVVDIPPVEVMPIIETGINVGTRTVSRALFALGSTPVWHSTSVQALSVSNESLAQDGSRLSATITNNTLYAAAKVTVAAVLFDASGTARAASKSTVSVPAKGSQPVVFTWAGGISGITRAEITVLPPF